MRKLGLFVTFVLFCVPLQGAVYFTDFGVGPSRNGTIKCADADGNVQTLADGLEIVHGIAVDAASGKVYWTESHRDAADSSSISRMNLDGSNPEILVTIDFSDMNSTVRSIALDSSSGTMYWNDATDFGHLGRITTATMDGASVNLVLEHNRPDDLALDLTGRTMYWTDYAGGSIFRSNLDGTNVEVVLSHLLRPYGMALDTRNGVFYYTDAAEPNYAASAARRIMKANLDGTNV